MSATELAALEAIFSCGICFASYSDIYKHDDKIVDTIKDPGLSLPGTVSKLWMTSCGHVICGRDLEGGGESLSCAFVQFSLIDSCICLNTASASPFVEPLRRYPGEHY
jgi:hypothetical protein